MILVLPDIECLLKPKEKELSTKITEDMAEYLDNIAPPPTPELTSIGKTGITFCITPKQKSKKNCTMFLEK